MAKPILAPYDRRIADLRKRTKHPVRRRLLDSLAAEHAPLVRITGILGLVSALFAEAERRRTHGWTPLAFARGLYHRSTLERWLPILLAQSDGEGGKDFYLVGQTLHVPHFRHSLEDMARAELKWAHERRLDRERKRRKRRAAAQTTPSRMVQKAPSAAFCDLSGSDSSLREENQETQDSHDQLIAAAVARAEAAEAVSGVGCEQPQEREPTSLEVTERALAEERALRAAISEPVPGRAVPVHSGPSAASPDTTHPKLRAWGWQAAKCRHLRPTDWELALAIEKVEAARTPLRNKAGAVVACIKRFRSGEWDMLGEAA